MFLKYTTGSEQLTSESEQLNSKGHKKLLSIFFLQDFAFFSSPTDMVINYFNSWKALSSYSQIFHKKLKYIQSQRLKEWRGHASYCNHDNNKALKIIFQRLVFPVKLYFSRNFEEKNDK